MTQDTWHRLIELLGPDPTTAGALIACVVAVGAAIAIHPRGWAIWAGLGIAMATFAVARTHTTTGVHLAASLHVTALVAVVVCAVGVAIAHLQRWTVDGRFPQTAWMVAMALLSAMAAAPSPVTGDAHLPIGAGLTLTCFVVLFALSGRHTTTDHARETSVVRGTAIVLVALPASWIAATRMPETAYTDVVGHPLAGIFVVALLIMALVRPAWAPWFLAASMGIAFSTGSLLTWPLIAGVGMCIFEWARRTGHPAAPLVGGGVWATLTLGGIQTWSVLGTSDTWGWWALTMGLAVAGMSAIHTTPNRAPLGHHDGT